MTTPVQDTTVRVFFRSKFVDVECAKVKCSNCDQCLLWNGSCEGIFRFSSESAVSYDVIDEALSSSINSHATFSAMWKTRRDQYCDPTSFIGRNSFRVCILRFVSCLTEPWVEIFSCPHCGGLTTARVLVVDGTCVSPLRAFLLACHRNETREVDKSSDVVKNTKLNLRRFFRNADAVKMMKQLCTAKGVSEATYTAFVKGTSDDAKCVASFLNNISHATQENGVHTYRIVCEHSKVFLLELLKSASVFGGLIKNASLVKNHLSKFVQHVQRTEAGSNSVPMSTSVRIENEDRIVFASFFPALFDYITRKGLNTFPSHLVPILQRSIEKIDLLESGVSVDYVEQDFDGGDVSVEEDLKFGRNLPGLRQRRRFRNYDAPTRDWQNQACHKDFGGKHKDISPGMFTISCLHGFYLGFFLMLLPESPETMFSLMYQRFPDANRVIIYDCACKLLEYCFDREPEFFKHMVALLDRLHAKGHVGCPRSGLLVLLYEMHSN